MCDKYLGNFSRHRCDTVFIGFQVVIQTRGSLTPTRARTSQVQTAAVASIDRASRREPWLSY